MSVSMKNLSNDDLYYNPDIKYYMVSTIYTDKFGLPSHIRAPWLTAESAKKYAKDAIRNPERYSDFEIFDEATLDIKVFIRNSNSDFEEITLRELLFNRTYLTEIAKDVRSNPGYEFDWK